MYVHLYIYVHTYNVCTYRYTYTLIHIHTHVHIDEIQGCTGCGPVISHIQELINSYHPDDHQQGIPVRNLRMPFGFRCGGQGPRHPNDRDPWGRIAWRATNQALFSSRSCKQSQATPNLLERSGASKNSHTFHSRAWIRVQIARHSDRDCLSSTSTDLWSWVSRA